MITTHPVVSLLISSPGFLSVWYIDLHLYVYVGLQVRRGTGRLYAPVRAMLEETDAVLVYTGRSDDRYMAGRAADLLIYAVSGPPSANEVN
jgi:hypothetical protein